MHMTAYMISQVEVLDDSRWQRYGEIAAPAIAQYGGRYLVRRAIPEVAEGDWAPPHPEGQQIIVVEFPSMEQLRGRGRACLFRRRKRLKEESRFRRFRLPTFVCWRGRSRRVAGFGRRPRARGRTCTGAS